MLCSLSWNISLSLNDRILLHAHSSVTWKIRKSWYGLVMFSSIIIWCPMVRSFLLVYGTQQGAVSQSLNNYLPKEHCFATKYEMIFLPWGHSTGTIILTNALLIVWTPLYLLRYELKFKWQCSFPCSTRKPTFFCPGNHLKQAAY